MLANMQISLLTQVLKDIVLQASLALKYFVCGSVDGCQCLYNYYKKRSHEGSKYSNNYTNYILRLDVL